MHWILLPYRTTPTLDKNNKKKLLRYNLKNHFTSFFSFPKFEIALSCILTISSFSLIVFLTQWPSKNKNFHVSLHFLDNRHQHPDQIAPKEFSQKTTNKIFMYLLAPFILQNFKKILRADPELWECAIFEPKMAHLYWTKIFWCKP